MSSAVLAEAERDRVRGDQPGGRVRTWPRVAGWAASGIAVLAVTARGVPAAADVLDLGLDAALMVSVGLLVTVGFLLPRKPALSATGRHLVRVAAVAAGVWSGAALTSLALMTAELTGASVARLARDPELVLVALGLPRGRALALVAVAGLLTALHLRRARTRLGAQVGLGAVVATSLPLLATGHAGPGDAPAASAVTALAHVLAVATWVGGLVAMILLVGRPAELRHALPRYSVLALGCFVVAAAGGASTAVAALGAEPGQWRSPYGLLVVVKLGLLTALGLAGYWHRRRSLPAVAAGDRARFARLAVVEVAVMAVAAALGVALGGVQPDGDHAANGSAHAAEHAAATGLQPIALAAGALAVVLYLSGALAARARGIGWPAWRVLVWLAAVALGVGVIDAAQQPVGIGSATTAMVLTSVGMPLLVIAAAPLELVRLVHERPGGWPARGPLAALAEPTNAAALGVAAPVLLARLATADRGLGSGWTAALVLVALGVVGLAGLGPLVVRGLGGSTARSGRSRGAMLTTVSLAWAGAAAAVWWSSREPVVTAWFLAAGAVLVVLAAVVLVTTGRPRAS